MRDRLLRALPCAVLSHWRRTAALRPSLALALSHALRALLSCLWLAAALLSSRRSVTTLCLIPLTILLWRWQRSLSCRCITGSLLALSACPRLSLALRILNGSRPQQQLTRRIRRKRIHAAIYSQMDGPRLRTWLALGFAMCVFAAKE